MKLYAGIAVSISLLVGSEEITRPEPIFTAGTVYRFSGEIDVKKEKKQKFVSSFKVNDVIRDGQHWFCNTTMSYLFEKRTVAETYLFQFACDTVNFYVLSANFAYRSIDEVENGKDQTIGDSIVYPLNMKVGDSLPNAWCKSIDNFQEGSSMTTIVFKHRYVEAIDTLKLPCGMIPAFRTSSLRSSRVIGSSKYLGNFDNTLDVHMKEWFSPALGVVKVEEIGEKSVSKGVLESYTTH